MSRSKHSLSRSELALGADVVETLGRIRVAVFGVGGVGSWCAEALVRSGVRDLTIVDADVVDVTNINRQLQALPSTVGQVKVEAMAERLRLVCPEVCVEAVNRAYDADTALSFDLASFDYVIDAIDSIACKVLLIKRCREAARASEVGRPVLFSSMGAAAKLDPTRIRVSPLDATGVCPLARQVRRRVREEGVEGDFLCVWSDEPARPRQVELDAAQGSFEFHGERKRVNGSLVHVTGAFGFALAGLVVQAVSQRFMKL